MNSLLYFKMTFGQRRARDLPKNLDLYVYEEMHSWLRHKPTMHPSHFWDLLNPTDANFKAPSRGLEDDQNEEDSRGEAYLTSYASAAAFDAAQDNFSKGDCIPEELQASPRDAKNIGVFPAPVPPTASSVHIRRGGSTSPATILQQCMNAVDLNDPPPAFPSPGGTTAGLLRS